MTGCRTLQTGTIYTAFEIQGGALLVIDPLGRRLGQAEADGPIFEEIPEGFYYPHEESDLHDTDESLPQTAAVEIVTAVAGTYRVKLSITSATEAGGLVLRVRLPNGKLEKTEVILPVQPGEVYHFEITYDPDATTVPEIRRL